MVRLLLTDLLWDKLLPALVESGIYRTQRLKMVIEGILWRFRTGAPWRDMPEYFGCWKSIFNQFNRWSKNGIWKKVFVIIRGEIKEEEMNFMDSTFAKVHQHAAGSRKSEERAIGNSRGGKTTKIHLLANGKGNPIDFEITGGEVHDVTKAETLLKISSTKKMIADKAFDSDPLRMKIVRKGISPIIPRRQNSQKANLHFKKHFYKFRHLIENLFGKLKNFRAIATRYDKLARNFASTVYIGCMLLWLKT